MDYFQAIILGIVQGLTEFIPISSTAHLVFASRWTNLYGGDPAQTTATIAVIQLGTLAAVFVYFAGDIIGITECFIRDHWAAITRKRGMRYSGTHGIRPIWLSEEAWLGWLIIIGSIPIGTVGVSAQGLYRGSGNEKSMDHRNDADRNRLLLGLAEPVGSQRKDIRHLGIGDAIVVGFSQVLALMPGPAVRDRRLWAAFLPAKA